MWNFRWLISFIIFIFTYLVLILSQFGTAHALMTKLEITDLVNGADIIVIGTVLEHNSQWNREHTGIATKVEISVEDKVKGTVEQGRITIVVPGGEVGEIGELVSDTPSFTMGERVVVFLKPLSEGRVEVYGGYQGKFTVDSGNVGKWTLEDFKTRIVKVLQGEPLPESDEQKAYIAGGPVITGISPATAPAGTNDYVTISGSSFGSPKGQVFFFYCSGQPDIKGNVQSWSDTRVVVDVPIANINTYPASASSGPVYIRTASGLESNEYPFEVKFSYGDLKWPGNNPVVQYKINPNTTDCAGEEIAVQNAASAWNAVSGKSFTFTYAGVNSSTARAENGYNEIMWTNLGNITTLARTTYWYNTYFKTISEVDMEFNNYYNWSTYNSPGAGQYDVQSIALHEFGHYLNLRDLYGNVSGYPEDTGKVMYGISTPGTTKRNLHLCDQEGIRWIYPGLEITKPSLQTHEATDTLATTVTLNGEITNTGGEECDQVKFQYRVKDTVVWADTEILNGLYELRQSAGR